MSSQTVEKNISRFIYMSSICACICMYFVERILAPSYATKSLLKWLAFCIPILLTCIVLKVKILDQTNFQKSLKTLRPMFLLTFACMMGIIFGYFLLQPWINSEKLRLSLAQKENITVDNFPIIAIYITVFNSLLEELFFRGFVYSTAAKATNKLQASLISAGLFSIYHVAIIDSWFNWYITSAIILGLFVVGLVFNYFTDKAGSFLGSWIVHVGANISINIIGYCILKGVL